MERISHLLVLIGGLYLFIYLFLTGPTPTLSLSIQIIIAFIIYFFGKIVFKWRNK